MTHIVLNMHKTKGTIHLPSIADMSPQSHCGDEEDGRNGLSS